MGYHYRKLHERATTSAQALLCINYNLIASTTSTTFYHLFKNALFNASKQT